MIRELAAVAALSTFASAAAAQRFDSRIDAEVERLLPQIVEARHRIHQNPELGNREFATARLVAEHLRGLGFEVDTGIAHTGVVGVLRGGRPGPVVALRADMDALPVTEEVDLPWKSTVRTTYLDQEVGVMHACGHDIHVAVQLGVASVLASMRDDIPGTIKLIFQPAEEGPPPGEEGGAEIMIREGVLENPRPAAIFALHSFAQMAVGTLGYRAGPMLAAVDHFRIDIQGRQAHGARPELSVDPVVMAAQAIMALQTIRSRNLSPLEPSVITVGIVRGGTRFNIIPGQVHLEGTVRTYNPEVRDAIERRMSEILQGITTSAGGSFTLDYERGSPATINNGPLTEWAVPVLARAVGNDRVVEIDPAMGGEDFSYFANEIPAFFFRLGQVAPGSTSGDHHTPTFLADDTAIPVGIRAMSRLVLDFLGNGGAAIETQRQN
ncbi:MAG: M20 metallopeptidase family protein [Longimicrobiales bacterium]